MIILPKSAEGKRKRKRDMRPVRAPRAVRLRYEAELTKQVDLLKAATANLSDIVRGGAGRAVTASWLENAARESRQRMDLLAPQIAGRFVDDADRANKKITEQNIAKALGVEFARVLDGPSVAADLDLAVGWNTSLIRSIPEQHWNKVGQAVLDNYRGAELPGGVSLTQRLKDIGGITQERAYVIARDQSSKLSGALNKSRQTSNGIETYKWRNSGDERVVGNPEGKYPRPTRAHGDHWHREGKTFSWSDPPADGNPGEAILCRCTAIPILDLDKLKAMYM